MTTLIIEIPDSETTDISNIVRARGGNVISIDADDKSQIVAGNNVFLEDKLNPAPSGTYNISRFKSFEVKNGKISKLGFFLR